MYYNIDAEQILSDAQIADMGLRSEELPEHHIYPLTIEKPDYDPETEGLEPDGPPAPAPDDPYAFIQHMRVYSILDRHREAKKREAKMRRKAAQARGVYLDGVLIETDPDSQARIAVLAQQVQAGSLEAVDFKAAHQWLKISAAQIVALNQEISAHVQKCFSKEREFVEAIEACASLKALNEIRLTEGWPSNAPPRRTAPAAAGAAATGEA